MLGKIEDRREKRQQRMRWLYGITDAMDMNLGKLLEMVWECLVKSGHLSRYDGHLGKLN